MINFAHRGASGYCPENTIPSFKTAIDMNATGFETDVQMTKDGVLVLIHDEKVNRTTDGVGAVKDYNYKDIKKLDAGKWFDSKHANTKIPTVEEILDLAKKNNIVLNLELKTDVVRYEGIEEKIIDMIHNYNMQENVIISSFNIDSINLCKKIDKEIKTGFLYTEKFYYRNKELKVNNHDAIHPPFSILKDKNTLDHLKNQGHSVNTWTVNNIDDIKYFISSGIDGIITNYPDLLHSMIKDKNN